MAKRKKKDKPVEVGIERDRLEGVGTKDLTPDEEKILKKLAKGVLTVEQISEELNIAKESVWPLIDKFRNKGYEVIEENRVVSLEQEPDLGRVIRLPGVTEDKVRILVLSNLGLGLKAQQPDLLATAYAEGEKAGVFFAIVMDMSAGKPKKGKEREHISELWSAEEQAAYITDYFPKASFNTYVLQGPRDLSHRPQSLVPIIATARPDIRYLGDLQATIHVRNVVIAVTHTPSEGSTYTKSYPLQNIEENYQEAIEHVFNGEDNPDIVLVGGINSLLGVPAQLPFSKQRKNNIYGLAIPGFHSITPSQRVRRRRGGSQELGFVILTIEFNKDGTLKRVIPDSSILTAYQKKRDYLADVEFKPGISDEEKKILELLIEDPRSKGDLSRRLNKAISYVEGAVVGLVDKGYRIEFSEAEKKYKLVRNLKTEFKPISLEAFGLRKAKVASASDPHVGSKTARTDLIAEVYRIAEEREVEKVFWSGDIFEGTNSYKGQAMALTHIGADAQRDFGLEVFPKSKIPSEFIMGSSHELAYLLDCGHNIVKTFCMLGRTKGKKLKYIGLPGRGSKGISSVNGIIFQLIHPKGGIPHGVSYRLQIRIEKLVSVIDDTKEKIVCCGHLHLGSFIVFKGIVGFMVPCLKEEDDYLVGAGLIPWLGMWIIEVWQDKYGNIVRVIPEYIPFEPKT